ncbi:MAG: hypothetical protein WBM08_15640 [Prochlorococcaceae cyanobacterium]
MPASPRRLELIHDGDGGPFCGPSFGPFRGPFGRHFALTLRVLATDPA